MTPVVIVYKCSSCSKTLDATGSYDGPMLLNMAGWARTTVNEKLIIKCGDCALPKTAPKNSGSGFHGRV